MMTTGIDFDRGERIPVAVLGATGSVGQRFIQLLENHPWFRLSEVAGSERSAGQPYEQVARWVIPENMPQRVGDLVVRPVAADAIEARVVFSALPSELARKVEPEFARRGAAVFSNASAFRTGPDVPLLLPEVNPEHLALIECQRRMRGWAGSIVTNPNCTSTGLTVALKALQDAFGVSRAFVVSMQALSGAGYPGVASMDILDNVLPNIEGEEEKVEWEPRKMLGRLNGETIELADMRISAHTNRVSVSDGHTVCASIELSSMASLDAVRQALQDYQAPASSRGLPSAPRPAIHVFDQPDRPQPRLDRMLGKGMTTSVGRLRPDPLLHYKFVVLSHNTIRGAAGGSIYNAELMLAQGLL